MSSYKNRLIQMVNELGNDSKFWGNINDKTSDIGSSNIRSMANICQNADCYEEIKLFIRYKIGKCNGWEKELSNKKVFGEAVLEHLDEIYNSTNKNDEEALKRIALYFGYLYWKKIAIEKGNELNKTKNQGRGNSSQFKNKGGR